MDLVHIFRFHSSSVQSMLPSIHCCVAAKTLINMQHMRLTRSHTLTPRPEDLIRNVNGIGVKREDIMSVLRMQWSGGAEPLNVVAERGEQTQKQIFLHTHT